MSAAFPGEYLYFMLALVIVTILAILLFHRVRALNLGAPEDERKAAVNKALDILVSSVLSFVLVWKLSPLLFAFESVRQEISALFYLPGGLYGSLLGLASSLVVLIISWLRLRRKGTKASLPLIQRFLGLWFIASLILAVPGYRIFELARQGVFQSLPEGQGASLGREAPDFGLPFLTGPGLAEDDSPQGQTLSAELAAVLEADRGFHILSSLQGKPVILNFWASWCPPCRAEITELVLLQKELGTNAVVLTINLGYSEADLALARDFARERGAESLINLLDLNGNVARNYQVQAVPTTFILDSDGFIQYRRAGAVSRDLLRPFILALLGRV